QKEDRQVPCRLRGCTETWTWGARAQAQAAEGTTEDPAPPKRLCESCEGIMRMLGDQAVSCRVRGCANQWTWTRWSQLEAHRAQSAKGSEARVSAPARMCEQCVTRISELKDEDRPCRVRGCKNKWIFNARAQLEAQLAGGGPEATVPKRMCASCVDR